jgi:hypothetical protein
MALFNKNIKVKKLSFLKEPENTERIFWTKHSKEKMRFYGLSENKLKRLLSNPKRIEEGIAPKTIAIMQSAGTKKHPTEIWLMYQKSERRIKIITAWRYPAVSPIGEKIPVPEDILNELRNTIS